MTGRAAQTMPFHRRLTTPLFGLRRWSREHFAVRLRHADGDAVRTVPAPGFGYLADPFLWAEDGRVWLFMEHFLYLRRSASIVVASVDPATLSCGPPQPVDLGPGHLSFPFLFRHAGRTWMVPETCGRGTVELYRADALPARWVRHRTIMTGVNAADTALVQHRGLWWLFTSVAPPGRTGRRRLEIWWTDDPVDGDWRPHPVNDRNLYAAEPHGTGRNAGAVAETADGLLRPAQWSRDHYGQGARTMRISTLTPTAFREDPFDAATDPVSTILGNVATHHASTAAGLVAWDERTRARASDLVRRRS